LVTKAVVTREQVMLCVQQLVVCEGEQLHLIAVIERAGLPEGAVVQLLAGLPYVQEDGERQRKITIMCGSDGKPFALGEPGARPRSRLIRAGGLQIASASQLHVVDAPQGPDYFNSAQTIGLTQEQMAFSLADDPRGYGDPDSGWRRVAGTTLLLAEPLADTPPGHEVFVLRYGPADAAGQQAAAFTASAELTPEGLVVRTPGFSALIGHPAGDEHGEPVLRLAEAGGP
jgi:hypothetical protein